MLAFSLEVAGRVCGSFTVQDGGKDSRGYVLTCKDVHDCVSDFGGWAVRLSCDVHESCHRLDGQIESRLIGELSVLWKASDRRIN